MSKFFRSVFLICLIAFAPSVNAQKAGVQIARLKYSGGGDWYVSPTSLPNLIKFCNENLGTAMAPQEAVVEAGSPELFNYPFVHITGHGNIIFNNQELQNIRNYLLAGGFLNINDSYGFDPFIRIQMKRIFPELDFVELPFSHPIYHQKYDFPNGLPKIHEHDNKPPQGFGLIYKGRLICYYNYESDLGDGWEDPEVHKDTPEKRLASLKMGANIISYVFLQ